MSTADYKGFRRFANELSKKRAAFAIRLWVFLAAFVITFVLVFSSFGDKRHISNAGVSVVSKLLVKVNKGNTSLHYLSATGQKVRFSAQHYGQLSDLNVARSQVRKWAFLSLGFAVVFALVFMLVFVRFFSSKYGLQKSKKIRLRGAEFLDVEDFAEVIKKEGLGSAYLLGNLPWLKEKVARHLYLSGDTGVGKSQALMDILQVIRGRGEKAILLDKNGELLSHFYDPETDFILGPFDERSENWTPFLEGMEEVDFERMAKSFIPVNSTGSKDDHWPEASVTVFSALLYQVSRGEEFTGSIDDILTKLLESTKMVESNLLGHEREVVKRGLTELINGTLASLIVDDSSPEHASSVIASIVPKIRALRYLRGLENKRDFSIRDWVKNDDKKGWLFIRVSEEEMDAAGPLVTAWFDTVIKAVLSLTPSKDRVIWNVIDELQSLGKINSLKTALNEGRKHGLRNILGFTSANELMSIYGEHSAKAMLSQCNTKLVFQTDEPTAAKWNAELLGMEEVVTENESLNFGKNDSQGLNEQRSDKYLIMPSEVQRLPAFTAYLKFSGDYPVTQIKTAYTERAVVAEPREPRQMPPPLVVKQKVILPRELKIEQGLAGSSLNEPLV